MTRSAKGERAASRLSGRDRYNPTIATPQQLFAVVRTVIFTSLFVSVELFWVPFRLLRPVDATNFGPVRYIAVLLWAFGGFVVLWTFGLFSCSLMRP